ncbi:DciA family protein [Streptomyces sp. RKCA744]|uniref:DciA family protein n=1 Tax=Streptomyces sp. RKCA744 TaxID=2959340 RepID=UPI0020A17D00|nr:DUF721 domain-containing protein [Streptomyces sp. RKCA744]MCO8308856.1 DUF721 domain-containing protein [Streptomyces sp. RKCA744]
MVMLTSASMPDIQASPGIHVKQLPDCTAPQEPSLNVDLARLALRWAKEGAWRRRFPPQGPPQPASRRGRRIREPITLCLALDELITQKTGWRSSTALTVIGMWPSIVGPEIARHITAIDVEPETGALVLRPSSSAWATQIRLLAPTLIRRMNAEIGSETIRIIRILSPTGVKPPAKAVPVAPPLAASSRWVPRSKTRLYSGLTRSPLPIDPAVLAAARRQAQQTPREPENLLSDARTTAASTADLMRARALLRARSQRQPSE